MNVPQSDRGCTVNAWERGRGREGERGGRVSRKWEEIWDDGFRCWFEFSVTMNSYQYHKEGLPKPMHGVVGVLHRGELSTESLCIGIGRAQ